MTSPKRRSLHLAPFLGLWLGMGVWILNMEAAQQKIEADRLMIRMMERVVRFIVWPDSALAGSTHFGIGIYGESPFPGHNPFGSVVEEEFKGQLIRGKPVQVLYCFNPQALPKCHVLWIRSQKKADITKLLSVTSARPILTFSDEENFNQLGIHITFFRQGDSLRFEVNHPALVASGLNADSRFLRFVQLTQGWKKP